MRLLTRFLLKISFLLSLPLAADMQDEKKYHQLGRDFVTCRSQIMIPELQKVYLADRAALYDLSKAACKRWKAQDKQSVFVPRVEDNELALDSWRWHVLEFFANSNKISEQGVGFMRKLQASCLSRTPMVSPRLSLQSSFGGYEDTVVFAFVLLVVPRLQSGLGLIYEIFTGAFNWNYDGSGFS